MADLSIGGVLGDTIERIRRRFPLHFAYALVPGLLSATANYFVNGRLASTMAGGTATPGPFLSPFYWLGMLIGILTTGWAVTGIIGSMLQSDRDDTTIADLLGISAANIGKYVILYLVWYVALVFGMLFFIIPGLIVLTLFAVGIPAMIDRQLGPWEALQESRQMSKGRRLKIFVTLLIFGLVLAIPVAVLFAAVGGTAAVLQASQAKPLTFMTISLLSGSLTTVFMSAYLTALYDRLGSRVSGNLVETFA